MYGLGYGMGVLEMLSLLVMLGSVVGCILLLIAAWRAMKAHESIAGSLVTIAKTAGEGLSRALNYVAQWAGIDGEAVVKFNTDFVAARMMPNELVALTQALQSGAITEEIYMYNLEQGEMLPPGQSYVTAAQVLEMRDPFREPETDGQPGQPPADDDEVQTNIPGGGGGR